MLRLLICGTPDRGDDGAAPAALGLLPAGVLEAVEVRRVGGLDVDDLADLPPGDEAVVADAAVGIEPGRVVTLSLDRLPRGAAGLRTRSSHEFPMDEVVALAGLLRGEPVAGRLIAIGGRGFGLGESLGTAVAAALPTFAAAIRRAIEDCRADSPGAEGPNGPREQDARPSGGAPIAARLAP